MYVSALASGPTVEDYLGLVRARWIDVEETRSEQCGDLPAEGQRCGDF